MIDYEVRAMLRAATAAKILIGWYGPLLSEKRWVIYPALGDADPKTQEEVLSYCEGLKSAGIEPLYRESEPVL